MDYTIKRIDKSQLNNLKLLYPSVYHKNDMNLEGLEKKFQTSNFGLDYVGYVAYSNLNNTEVPAAYYGVFPMIATTKGNKILCAQSGDTMTHKDHRKKGLFTKLAQLTYKTAQKEGVEFIFGFPSPSSYPGFKNKLNWVFPFNMVKFKRFIPTIPLGLIKQKFRMKIGTFSNISKKYIKNSNLISEPISNLWIRKSNNEFEILRDENYWEYKKSLRLNKLFLEHEEIGMIIKYDGNISIGDIIGTPNSKLLKKLFKKLDMVAMLTGAIQIRSYFTPSSHLHDSLSPFGTFSQAMPYGYLNLSHKYDPSKLNLTFLDYDYF